MSDKKLPHTMLLKEVPKDVRRTLLKKQASIKIMKDTQFSLECTIYAIIREWKNKCESA